jgi:hypothetical protein
MWIIGAQFSYESAKLPPEAVDNQPQLWKSRRRRTGELWKKLWITGVKPVEKTVEKTVDNFKLWISNELSTIRPQGAGLIHSFFHRFGGEFSA